MATEIEIDTVINTDRSEQGLSKLRSGLKELISLQGQVGAGSDQFKKLQKAINDTEGKIGDLTDSFQTLKGSGVERLNSSFGLLKEGFLSFDGGKLKAAFQGVGAAMSAIPIFLLIEGVKLLYDNFDKVVQVFKKLDPAFQKQIAQTKELTDANSNLESALKGVVSYYDRQIKLSQAAGSDQLEILELQVQKQNELEQSLSKTADNYIRLYQLGGEGAQGYYDKALEFETKAKDAAYEGAALLLQIDEVNRKRKLDNAKEAARLDKEETDRILARAKLNKSINDAGQAAADANNKAVEEQEKAAKEKELADAMMAIEQAKALREQRAAVLKTIDDQEKANRLANDREVIAEQIKNWEKEKKLAEEVAKAKTQATDNYVSAAASLTSAFFNMQLNQAKGNAAAELKIREKQFKVDKAFSIARAIIDGVRSVQAALTLPPPASYILAASNGVLAAANIAKIASTKFNAGATATDTSSSIPTGSFGGGGGSSTPTQQVPGAGSNAFNPSGISNVQTDKKRESQRVYVLESDIRNATNRVNVIESRATFG